MEEHAGTNKAQARAEGEARNTEASNKNVERRGKPSDGQKKAYIERVPREKLF